MRVKNVVDPETAQKIVQMIICTIHGFGKMKDHPDNLRPVLWSFDMVTSVFENVTGFDLPHRDLCHLICSDNEIHALTHLPQYHSKSGAFLSTLIVEYRLNYDGAFTHDRPPRLYVVSDDLKRQVEPYYRQAEKMAGNDISATKVISLQDCLRRVAELPLPVRQDINSLTPDEELLLPFVQACALEAFAFSPYTTVKHRPTLNQVLNPPQNPKKKDYPAIEIIRLRLPEKREHSEPTGRKIDLRFPVKEHLRRQPTKEGIKLITIAEHWRGPESAPIKPKTQKIYKVVK